MGKYDEIREEDEWTYKAAFLRAIANELAEANRLKRLQMNYQNFKVKDEA